MHFKILVVYIYIYIYVIYINTYIYIFSFDVISYFEDKQITMKVEPRPPKSFNKK